MSRRVVLVLLFWVPIGGLAHAELERPPAYLHGRAAISADGRTAIVANRFIGNDSVIFVTIDTSTAPTVQPDTALSAIGVRAHGDGFFEVAMLDGSAAPATGVPFSWVLFNLRNYAGNQIGRAVLPRGAREAIVAAPITSPGAVVLLTVDSSGAQDHPPLQELMVTRRSNHAFAVSQIDGAPASQVIPFNYMVVSGGLRTGVGQIPGDRFAWDFPEDVSLADAVFVTLDRTANAGPAVTVPFQRGIKVVDRHIGQFSVGMLTGPLRRDFGVRFSYVIIKAQPQWEEYGPTGLGGLPFSIAVDPTNNRILYGGSIHGGIWRTLDGGDTWRSVWPPGRPLAGVLHVIMKGQHLYALTSSGYLLESVNSGVSWTQSRDAVTGASAFGARIAVGNRAVLACTGSGLWDHATGTWKLVDPSPGVAHPCTDVVVDTDETLYVAFKDLGVMRFHRGWKTLKNLANISPAPDGTRIALGNKSIMLNVECTPYIADRAALDRAAADTTPGAPGPEAVWRQVGLPADVSCGSSGSNSTLLIAMSPNDDKHYIIGGRSGFAHTRQPDGSYHWIPIDKHGLGHYFDFRQATFVTDQLVIGASDAGMFLSRDGGQSWTEAFKQGAVTDGAPISAFLGLSVSRPDQFNRVMVTGNLQDLGATMMVGGASGVKGGGAEGGIVVVAPTPRLHDGRSRSSSFRTYSTELLRRPEAPDKNNAMVACDFSFPGPDFAQGQEQGYFENATLDSHCQPANPAGLAVGDAITAIAVAQDAVDHVLLGTRDGVVYRAVARSDGLRYEALPSAAASSVSTIYFAADKTVYIGYAAGDMFRIDNPFDLEPTRRLTKLGLPSEPSGARYATRVVQFAGRYDDASELYVAYGDERFTYKQTKDWDQQLTHDPGIGGVFVSRDRGASWSDYTGALAAPGRVSDLRNNLAPASKADSMEVVGLVRDPVSDMLYVATGHNGNLRPNLHVGWVADSAPGATVFRSRAGSNVWSPFGQGLPLGLPIVALGVGQEIGLFVATYGRGVWWRRDAEVIAGKR